MVVYASERTCSAMFLPHYLCGAVPAYVIESPHHAVITAYKHNRLSCHLGASEIPGRRHFAFVAYKLPYLSENVRLFVTKNRPVSEYAIV